MNPGPQLLNRIKRIFKLRFAVLYPAGLYALWVLRADAVSFKWGSAFIVAGLMVRSWANGYAIKMDKLTTSGPYGYLRHPLYAGTLLIVIGFAVLLNSQVWGVLFVIFFVVVYTNTMRTEERMLETKFGDAYRAYRSTVPPLWPGIKGVYAAGEKWPFAWERYWRSQEYKLILWTTILTLVIYLHGAWEMSSGLWTASMKTAALGIVLLAAADAGITIILKSARKS